MTVKPKMVSTQKPLSSEPRIPLRNFIGSMSWEEIFQFPDWTPQELSVLNTLHKGQKDKVLLWTNASMKKIMPSNWRQIFLDINQRFIDQGMIFRIHFWQKAGWGLLRTLSYQDDD